MVGWIKNVISYVLPGAIGQGAQVFEKKSKAKLVDVTEGASLAEEARRRSLDLLSVLRRSGTSLDKLRLKLSARRKVRKGLASFYDTSELREEVTEKIIETAEADPYFRKLFR